MNKITNWVFGSFFRTLGRVLVYIIIGIIISYALKDLKMPKFNLSNLLFMNVFADEREVILDGTTLTSSNYKVINSGNRTLRFDSDTLYPDSIEMPSYFLLTLCADNEKITSWYVNNNSVSEINIYNTNYKCNFPNSTYTGGHIVYIYGTYNKSTNCNASLLNCFPSGNITFYNPSASSWSLLSYQDSNESINIDFSGDTIISQNQEIINQNTQIIQGQQSIINNQNQNTQDIIDNQNANSQAQIDSQKVCSQYDNTSYVENGILQVNGEITNPSNVNYGITDYIRIDKNSEITVLNTISQSFASCFYNVNKTLISCVSMNGFSGSLTIPNDGYYFRGGINLQQNKPTYKICKNGNQAMNDTLKDINSSLTDDSPPTNLDSLNNSAGWLPAGPVDSILNLPLSFLTNLNTNLSKSCQPVNLPLPYINKNLPLPCVNTLYNEINGLPNWINIIGTIASAFILFGYFINLYKYVDDTLTFRENNYIDNWSGV